MTTNKNSTKRKATKRKATKPKSGSRTRSAAKPKTSAKKSPSKPTDANREADGRFKKGRQIDTTPKKPKRVTATEIIDLASDHLAHEYAGTKSEIIFRYGFSPVKEIMRMYAEECAKKRPNFDKKISLLKSLLPYIYPTMKSVEFEIEGDLPTLTLVLAEDDDPDDQGKGRNGTKIPTETK